MPMNRSGFCQCSRNIRLCHQRNFPLNQRPFPVAAKFARLEVAQRVVVVGKERRLVRRELHPLVLDEPADELGMANCQHEPEDAAVAESDDIRMLQLELVQQRGGVLQHGRVAQRSRHIGSSALTDLVGRDDAMLLGEEIELPLERVLPRIASAMQQDQRGAVAVDRVKEAVLVDDRDVCGARLRRREAAGGL